MENTIKVTKAMQYEEIKQFIPADRLDLIERLDKDIAAATKPRSAKPTKAQLENAEIKEVIISVLESAEGPMTVKELLANEDLAEKCGTSTQKISALLTSLRKEGRVERVMDKKTALYSIAQ